MNGLLGWLGLGGRGDSPIEQAAERRPYWMAYLEAQLADLEALAARGGQAVIVPGTAAPVAGAPAPLSARSLSRLQEGD